MCDPRASVHLGLKFRARPESLRSPRLGPLQVPYVTTRMSGMIMSHHGGGILTMELPKRHATSLAGSRLGLWLQVRC